MAENIVGNVAVKRVAFCAENSSEVHTELVDQTIKQIVSQEELWKSNNNLADKLAERTQEPWQEARQKSGGKTRKPGRTICRTL